MANWTGAHYACKVETATKVWQILFIALFDSEKI